MKVRINTWSTAEMVNIQVVEVPPGAEVVEIDTMGDIRVRIIVPAQPAVRPLLEASPKGGRRTCKKDGCDWLAGDPEKGETGSCLDYCIRHCSASHEKVRP